MNTRQRKKQLTKRLEQVTRLNARSRGMTRREAVYTAYSLLQPVPDAAYPILMGLHRMRVRRDASRYKSKMWRRVYHKARQGRGFANGEPRLTEAKLCGLFSDQTERSVPVILRRRYRQIVDAIIQKVVVNSIIQKILGGHPQGVFAQESE